MLLYTYTFIMKLTLKDNAVVIRTTTEPSQSAKRTQLSEHNLATWNMRGPLSSQRSGINIGISNIVISYRFCTTLGRLLHLINT